MENKTKDKNKVGIAQHAMGLVKNVYSGWKDHPSRLILPPISEKQITLHGRTDHSSRRGDHHYSYSS